ncbi:hypothetical protein KL921_000431 [Ogataea angusta]|uniref:Ribosome-associated complex subunit SSZ1 n=1 Tax=Pichia angusta TaxID=870730 RepID=A0AAN6I7V5_PICAN|nr:uncharacterized protein KL928_000360 [Ogataea angusta]KAG7814157.1 hypothetical protein KL921_000431 [Ogataea angusta]KAG7821885.1 hypothetical protein KL928_000360 [Ogataea angusta]KAG7853309.1 hypothetical protein KL941_000359 [Ogataea angusta]
MASIGIAFGNSTSSIAIANDDGKIDVIANPDGDRFIASALSYVGEDEYHGAQAQAQLVRNPNSTIVNFRDYIGLPFDKIDPTYSQKSAHPINLGGKTGYSINDKQVTVDEIATSHLKQIKAAAEDYIGEKIEGAVIAVPTNFSEEQKAALKKISSDADIKVLQLINEPTAALLAHLVAKDALNKDKLFVVADFGGVRSDAAVIAVRGGILTVLATAHDYELGGDKLDDCLVEYFAKEFQKKYKVDPTTNARSLAKLKSACIITKKTLSNVQTSTISIDSLAEGYDFHSSINRLRFEVAGRSVFTRMSAFVESVVAKAGLETLDIDEVLLVGGSSNIPKVAANIAAVFPESTVVSSPSTDSKLCNPNELISRGAALQASIVASFDVEEIEESTQPVVTNTQHIAKPIGIKTGESEFLTVVSRETAYPIRKSVTLKAGADDVFIELYEGERQVKETVVEAEKFSDDEDSEEEEPEVVKSVHYVPGTLLAQMALRGVGEGSSVEVIVNINKDGKLQLVGRSGDKVVKGEI